MAFGTGTIGAFGGAAESLFAAKGFGLKAKGQRLEAESYDLAADLARKNKQFAETSTAIKTTQEQRKIFNTLGGQAADIASSGFAVSGSALDIMRDSASQGALTKAVIGQQGLIEEDSYEQQAKSFGLMAEASRLSAKASEGAGIGSIIGAGFKAAAGVGSLFTGGFSLFGALGEGGER